MKTRKNKNNKQTKNQKQKTLHYLLIMDRSGSMEPVKQQTLNNLNEQFSSIRDAVKKNNIKAYVTLMLFDKPYGTESPYQYIFVNIPANEVKDITAEQYVPRGGTPLQDAIGTGIEDLQKVLGDKIGEENSNILVTVLTDGEENSSNKFSREQVEGMIKHLSSDGKWIFTFLGAGGINEVKNVAVSYGINASNVLAYANDVKGHSFAGRSLSVATSNYIMNYASGTATGSCFFSSATTEETK